MKINEFHSKRNMYLLPLNLFLTNSIYVFILFEVYKMLKINKHYSISNMGIIMTNLSNNEIIAKWTRHN